MSLNNLVIKHSLHPKGDKGNKWTNDQFQTIVIFWKNDDCPGHDSDSEVNAGINVVGPLCSGSSINCPFFK